MLKVIDRWIDSLDKNTHSMDLEVESRYIMSHVVALADVSQSAHIIITGSVALDVLEKTTALLMKACEDMGISTISFEIAKNATYICNSHNQYILIVEKKRESIISDVNKEIVFLRNTGRNILGMILV